MMIFHCSIRTQFHHCNKSWVRHSSRFGNTSHSCNVLLDWTRVVRLAQVLASASLVIKLYHHEFYLSRLFASRHGGNRGGSPPPVKNGYSRISFRLLVMLSVPELLPFQPTVDMIVRSCRGWRSYMQVHHGGVCCAPGHGKWVSYTGRSLWKQSESPYYNW